MIFGPERVYEGDQIELECRGGPSYPGDNLLIVRLIKLTNILETKLQWQIGDKKHDSTRNHTYDVSKSDKRLFTISKTSINVNFKYDIIFTTN